MESKMGVIINTYTIHIRISISCGYSEILVAAAYNAFVKTQSAMIITILIMFMLRKFSAAIGFVACIEKTSGAF